MRAGLGTDGAASNNDLDMFEAMRMAALLHKVSTRRSARAAGAAGAGAGDAARRRSARAGATASAASSRASRPTSSPSAVDGARQTPMFDPISHLVYVARGDDVRTTIVAGRVLMRDGRCASLDASGRAARRARDGRARAAGGRCRGGAGAPRGEREAGVDGDPDRPGADFSGAYRELRGRDPRATSAPARRSTSSPCSRARSCSWPI